MAFGPILGRIFPGPFSYGEEEEEIILVSDTFTDTNAVHLHDHIIAPINTPAATWADLGGDLWTISSNKAVITTYVYGVINLNSGVTNYTVSADVIVANSSSSRVRGIIVRGDGINFFSIGLIFNANLFVIYEGVSTSRAQTAFTVTPGTVYAISAVCSGSTISATVNGGNTISYASAATVDRSYVGLCGRTAASDIYDNFKVTVP